MLGRVLLYDVRSLDEVIGFIESGASETVIICDVDNTLVPQDVTLREFEAVVNASIDRLEAHPKISRVIALTNGPERGVPRLESRGNKPWTSRRRLGLVGSRTPIAVVGDQVLTDGLMAWRLQAPFLYLVIDDEIESARQTNMRRFGRVLMRVLFRKVPTDGLESSGEQQ